MALAWENIIIFRKYLVTMHDSGSFLYLVGMCVSSFSVLQQNYTISITELYGLYTKRGNHLHNTHIVNTELLYRYICMLLVYLSYVVYHKKRTMWFGILKRNLKHGNISISTNPGVRVSDFDFFKIYFP